MCSSDLFARAHERIGLAQEPRKLVTAQHDAVDLERELLGIERGCKVAFADGNGATADVTAFACSWADLRAAAAESRAAEAGAAALVSGGGDSRKCWTP